MKKAVKLKNRDARKALRRLEQEVLMLRTGSVPRRVAEYVQPVVRYASSATVKVDMMWPSAEHIIDLAKHKIAETLGKQLLDEGMLEVTACSGPSVSGEPTTQITLEITVCKPTP